jgi:hypothetical protein
MKFLTLTLLFSLLLVRAADSDLAGAFTGEWKSNGASGGGSYSLTLQPGAAGAWTGQARFNVAGEDIKATVKQVTVTGQKVEITYDFETQGTALAGKASGELKGSTITGTYQSLIGDMVIDEGTWSVTRSK